MTEIDSSYVKEVKTPSLIDQGLSGKLPIFHAGSLSATFARVNTECARGNSEREQIECLNQALKQAIIKELQQTQTGI